MVTAIFNSTFAMGDISLEEARKAMIAKRFGGNVNGASTGGEGSARRKKKGAHKSGGGMFYKCKYLHFHIYCFR